MSTATVLLAAALTFGPSPASATTSADLNGDGTPDKVTVLSPGTPDQILVAEVDGTEYRAESPSEAPDLPRPPRVVDLNNDGTQELMVRDLHSSNSHVFSVWQLNNGKLTTVGTPDGHQLRLYEGTEDTTRTGYGCATQDDTRMLVTLFAEEDNANTWSGRLDYYTIDEGITTPTGGEITFDSLPFVGPSLIPDADTCA